MGTLYEEIDEQVTGFLRDQRMFFVATAPAGAEGHVNLSPKGLEAFRVLGPRRVGYVDYNGSGVETIAHLRENGRIVLMFCAFEGPPKIMRLHGKGRAVGPEEPEFTELLSSFSPLLAVRSIIVADISRIASSCGFGVPLYDYLGERDHAMKWAERKGEDGIASYQHEKNARSIDGLPGLAWIKS
jgi:hypothetical protein